MMRDYKFRRRDNGFGRKRRPRHIIRLGLIAVIGGAGYASFQLLNPNSHQTADAELSGPSHVIELSLPEDLIPFGPGQDSTVPQNGAPNQPTNLQPSTDPDDPQTDASEQPGTGYLHLGADEEAEYADASATPPTKPTAFPTTARNYEIERKNTETTPNSPPPALKQGPFRLDYQMEPGDTLSTVFQSQGLAPRTLYQVLDSLDAGYRRKLTDLHPGEILHIHLDESLELQRLEIKIDATRHLLVTRNGGKITSTIQSSPTERRRQCLTAVVHNSLYGATQNAGIPSQIAHRAIDLFRHQIDFAKHTRKGDSLSILFEQVYADNELIKTGAVLAAEFTNGNQHYSALRYTNSNGVTDYYSADGEPLKKDHNSFLRAPLIYTRVSSPFSAARIHPILRRVRPHTGIDFAAPAGRRVLAAAAGQVSFSGIKGGYGKLIIIRHGSHYETRYAHLMRFATGLSSGNRVKRGDTIGYVGQTGLATGPHLHYEIRVDGRPINPLAAKLPFLDALDDKEKVRFIRETKPLLAELQHHQHRPLLVDSRWDPSTETSPSVD